MNTPTSGPILIATGNPGKLEELRTLLGTIGIPVISLDDISAVPAFPEEGESYEENAVGKAVHYSRHTDHLTLADDSGLEVDCLGGIPGVRSARFAGEEAGSAEKCRKILSLLAGVPAVRRGAGFRCVLALARKGELIRVFRGTCRGRIATQPSGEKGFGFDPVFFYPLAGKTFAELAPDEKHRFSHRGRALRSLLTYLKKEWGQEN